MHIVIVGATGMLGQALYCHAKRRNHLVTGIARTDTDITLDITHSALLEQTLERVNPNVVINAAALTSLAACEENPGFAYLVNARPVAVMAHFCRDHGAYLIQISTDHYFSSDGTARHQESSPVSLLNEYARTKFAGEAFALTVPEALVVRTNIIGFRNRGVPTFIEWTIQALQNGERMTLFDDYFTSSIDVTSFANSIFDLLPHRPAGVLNLAARDVCHKKECIEMLASTLNMPMTNIETGSVASLCGARRADSLGLDVSLAEQLLGYELPTVRQTIYALADEYRRMTS